MAGYVKGSKEHVDYTKKRQLQIGQVNKLKKDGLNTSEIAVKLGLSEYTVRSCQNVIAEAEANGYK